LRVLLADDNVDFAESLAVVLRNEGHEVRVAHDGKAALQLARETMPEVGLFDIGMPGLDGYQLAAALRREPEGASCLLVAITGWGQEGDRAPREAGRHGAAVGRAGPLRRRVGLRPPADGAQAARIAPAAPLG
jgi:CheY-like chemotaxis protein